MKHKTINLSKLIKTIYYGKCDNVFMSSFYVTQNCTGDTIVWIMRKHYSDVNAKYLMGKWYNSYKDNIFHRSDVCYHILINKDGTLKFVDGRLYSDERFTKLVAMIINENLKIKINNSEYAKLDKFNNKRWREFQQWLKFYKVS